MRVFKGVLGLLCLMVVAVLGYGCYDVYNADSEAVVFPDVVFEGQVVGCESVNWFTPVIAGMQNLEYNASFDAVSNELGSYEKNEFTMGVSGNVSGSAVVYDSERHVVLQGSVAEFDQFVVEENGEYFVEIKLDTPSVEQEAFGDFVYKYSFIVDVPPPPVPMSITVPDDTTFYQGDLVFINVDMGDDEGEPVLTSKISSVGFLQNGDRSYMAIIPINYTLASGAYPYSIEVNGEVFEYPLDVIQQTFTVQRFEMASSTTDSTMNNPEGPSNWATRIVPLRDTMDEEIYWTEPFISPIVGRISSDFGLYRYINDAPPTRHTGVDTPAEVGTPVPASNRGRVVLAEYVIYTGNTIVIEHGGGLKTYYEHLETMDVEVDQIVEQGEIIGTVGSTGYSTGPHLHFEVMLGYNYINPWTLVDDYRDTLVFD